MSKILTDAEIAEIEAQLKTEKLRYYPTRYRAFNDIEALITSHRALVAERDKPREGFDEEGLSLSERCCGSVKGTLRSRIDELESQVRSLTEERDRIFEERLDFAEGYSSSALINFRDRAVEAIRARAEEWRLQGERWHQKYSQEPNEIVAKQDLSDRDCSFNQMAAAITVAQLIESLPLEPPQ